MGFLLLGYVLSGFGYFHVDFGYLLVKLALLLLDLDQLFIDLVVLRTRFQVGFVLDLLGLPVELVLFRFIMVFVKKKFVFLLFERISVEIWIKSGSTDGSSSSVCNGRQFEDFCEERGARLSYLIAGTKVSR